MPAWGPDGSRALDSIPAASDRKAAGFFAGGGVVVVDCRRVGFEITEHPRQAIDDYIRAAGRKPGDFLFGSRCGPGGGITARQYARLVAGWIASVGLDSSRF